MGDSTSASTSAGYQPDGTGAQQENTSPENGGAEDKQVPGAAENQEQTAENDAVKDGNPLTALVQNRQNSRQHSNAQQQQINALQDELTALKQAPKTEKKPWSNPFDATDAPVDHLRAEVEHYRARVTQLETDGRREIADTRNIQALNDFEANVAQEISISAQTTPEILQAYGYVNEQYTKIYQSQGMSGRALAQAVRNGVLQAYVNGQTNGLSHTETTAQMALNMGYKTSKADPVKRGQKAASQSVGQATGAGGDTTAPSAQQLAKMTRAELKKVGGVDRIRDILQGNVPIG